MKPPLHTRKWLAVILTLLALAAALETRNLRGEAVPEWYTHAQIELGEGNESQAEQELVRGLAAHPKYAAGYELLSDCYMATRRADRAIVLLDRLRTLEPDRPHLAARFAEAYLSSDAVHALRYAREAVIAEPRSPRARMLLAYALARSGGGMDAVYEAAIARRLAPSAELEQGVQEASILQEKPAQLTPLLRALIIQVPYE